MDESLDINDAHNGEPSAEALAPTEAEFTADLGTEETSDPEFGALLAAVAAAPPARPVRLPGPGDVLGQNIELVRPLDEGGMGRVYVARDLVLGRQVAVKIVIPRGDEERHQRLVERFEQEARATARLNHPTIVTIHQFGVWRDGDGPGVPWVVLELLEGESLAERLEARGLKTMDVDEALRIGADVCRGLQHAHAAGVIHRDLKPANVFLTVSGGVKILDFGLAWLDTADGDLAKAGTPAYMAPEQWRGETQGFGVDLWAVGVLLHKLLAGKVPFASGRDVLLADQAPRLTALKDTPAVAELVTALLHPAPEERLSDAAAVVERIEGLRRRHAEKEGIGDQPFIYLEPFTESDAARFFGREVEVGRLSALLQRRARVVLVGPSGAGKSSLIRAGLIPYLRRDDADMEITTLRPGSDPLQRLTAALRRLGLEQVPTSEEVEKAPGVVGARLRARARASGSTIVIVVDQLEECLGALDARRTAFLTALTSAADTVEGPIRLVATARDDYLARLAGEAEARELLSGALVPLGAPDRGAMREAIVEPARRAGSPFSQDVVEEILDSLADEPVPLPLLQLTASRLWERRATGQSIGLKELEALGGVTGILAGHADEVYLSLPADQRGVGREVLLNLVTPDGARRRVAREELVELDDENTVESTLDSLVRGHLLRVLEDELEIVHDAIIEHWERLRTWLAESNVDRRFKERVERASTDWDVQGRPRGLLWRGDVLSAAVRWRMDGPAISARATEFLEHAENQKRRSLWLRRLGVAVVVLIALGIAAGTWFANLRLQEEEAEARESQEKADELVAFMLFELHDGLSDVGRLDLLEDVVGTVEEYYDDEVRGPDDAFRRTVALEHLGDVRRAQGDLEAASDLYARSLALSDQWGDGRAAWQDARAETLEAQAEVQRVMGNYPEARASLERARDLRQSLAMSDLPEAWANLSAVELAIGDLLRQTGALKEATAAYESALEIREMLVADASTGVKARHDVAEASMRLADVSFEQGGLSRAEEAYRQAIRTLESVVEASPGNARWQLTLALGQMRLAEVLAADGRPADAWPRVVAARDSFARLSRLDPANADWRLQLALAEIVTAGTARELGKIEEAAASVGQALAIISELLEIDPDNADWQRAAASSWTESGEIALEQGDTRKALESFDRGLKVRQMLLEQSPKDPNRMRAVASSWFHVATARRTLGESEAAVSALLNSLEVRRSLVERPDSNAEWLYEQAAAARRLSSLYKRIGKVELAQKALKEAAGAAEELVKRQPGEPRARRLQAVLQIQLGNSFIESGDLDDALTAFETAARDFEAASESRPSNDRWKRDSAMARNKLGDVLRLRGELNEAADAYKSSLQTMLKMVEADPQAVSLQRDVSVVLDRIGDVRKTQGQLVKARSAYTRSLEIAKQLAELDPQNIEWKRDLSVSHDKLGDLLYEEGNFDEAVEEYAISLSILDTMLSQDPDRMDWQRDRALSLERIGRARLKAGDRTDAVAALNKARMLIETLQRAGARNDLQLAVDRARVLLGLADAGSVEPRVLIEAMQALETLDPKREHAKAQERKRDLAIRLAAVRAAKIAN